MYMTLFVLNKSELVYFVKLYKLEAYFLILKFIDYVIIGHSVQALFSEYKHFCSNV